MKINGVDVDDDYFIRFTYDELRAIIASHYYSSLYKKHSSDNQLHGIIVWHAHDYNFVRAAISYLDKRNQFIT